MAQRLQKGKERADRLPEKFGEYANSRPKGNVFWFHALSVGESLALIPVIEQALDDFPGAHVVITTSTVTSIDALDRAGLPDRALHVLLPADTGQATRRFLEHWQPSVAVFAELDFWPRLLFETHKRGIPMVLVNARMAERNFKSRRRLGSMMRAILRYFDPLLLQDDESAPRFQDLGAKPESIQIVGPLKAAARPLPADHAELEAVRFSTKGRPIWFAAATHPAEETEMLSAHAVLLRSLPSALLIIAPRYLESVGEILEGAKRLGLRVAQRSVGEGIEDTCNVYVADTFGEMGIWYRIAPISFVGHSLAEEGAGGGGKNPYEAAALGSAIIVGPSVSDFSDTYQLLGRSEATILVHDKEALVAAVLSLQDEELRVRMTDAASGVIAEQGKVGSVTWQAIKARLKPE